VREPVVRRPLIWTGDRVQLREGQTLCQVRDACRALVELCKDLVDCAGSAAREGDLGSYLDLP